MRRLLLPLLMTVAFAAAAPAFAEQRTEVRSQREDAGARVRQVERSGGRVLQAEPMQRGGEEVYRLKVLTPEGRVRVIQGGDARELTGRRRDMRDAQGNGVARERQQRAEVPRRGDPQRGDPQRGGDRAVD
jgi:hypothetical protein